VLYLDTGCLVKLYYPEPESAAVAKIVVGEVIVFTDLHDLELTTAMQLKVFRGEAKLEHVTAAIVCSHPNSFMFAEEKIADFQGASEASVWGHTGRASNAENRQIHHGPKGWLENGPAPALLLSHVSQRICSLVAPWRRAILQPTNIKLFG